jgi:hypothetical protein
MLKYVATIYMVNVTISGVGRQRTGKIKRPYIFDYQLYNISVIKFIG